MKFYDFLDTVFHTAAHKNDKEGWSIGQDAKAKAANQLVNHSRLLRKWLYVPYLLMHYALIKVGILSVIEKPKIEPPIVAPKPEETATQVN